MTSSKTHSVPVLLLLPLRLSVGLAFLIGGQAKIAAGGWGTAYAANLSEFLTSNLENTYGFYRPFVESVVLPHVGGFAPILAWGELLVGVSIFLGLFTRFGAAAGIVLALHYAFVTGVGVWMPSLETMLIWALFTLMVCSAGRGLGVDQILRSNRRIRLFT
jgi:thiosulfate dehydrogenase [quinone] large subunit